MLRVIVRDRNTKKGISNAGVMVGNAYGLTGTNGDVTLNVLPGSYGLRVTHNGYTPLASMLAVSVNGTAIVELVPQVKML